MLKAGTKGDAEENCEDRGDSGRVHCGATATRWCFRSRFASESGMMRESLVATLLAGFKEISSSAGNADDIWNSRNRKGWAYFADSMLDAEMGVSSACRKPIASLGTCGIARVQESGCTLELADPRGSDVPTDLQLQKRSSWPSTCAPVAAPLRHCNSEPPRLLSRQRPPQLELKVAEKVKAPAGTESAIAPRRAVPS